MEELHESVLKEFADHKHLRVLLLFDESGEWEEPVSAIELSPIIKVTHGGNDFAIKAALHSGEWADKKVFIYCRQRRPETQEELKAFALLDVLIANRELPLGDVARFGDKYGLNKEQQRIAKPFMKGLLQNPAVQKALGPILTGAENFDQQNLARGLVGYILKAPQPEPWPYLIARLLSMMITAPEQWAKARRDLLALSLTEPLLTAINGWVDEHLENLEAPGLHRVLQKVKYNAVMAAIPQPKPGDPYAPLRITHSAALAGFGYSFEQIAQHPKLGPALHTALEEGASDIHDEELLRVYGADAPWRWMPQGQQWLLLRDAIAFIPARTANALRLLMRLDESGGKSALFENALNAAVYSCYCIYGIAEAAAGFQPATAEDFIGVYETSWYAIDQDYRQAIRYRRKADGSDLPNNISLAPLADAVNDAYNAWLERSNRAWLQTVSDAGFDWKSIRVPKQWDFYAGEIAGLDQKVVVIISDALRYEVAQELLGILHKDTKNIAGMRPVLAAIPSKTSVGMSNLLPGRERLFAGDKILIDGQSSATAEARRGLLQAANPSSDVIRYDALMAYGSKERQWVRDNIFNKQVVYVYHDAIDARGDVRKSEHQTFDAVEDALHDLSELVKKLHNQWNIAKVFVTADHGFLYQERGIEDKDKEDAPVADEDGVLLAHNRVMVYKTAVKPELGYSVQLRAVSAFTDDAWVVIPASINRYRRGGAGHQYVHGGASLQELIVPVIESGKKREAVVAKVGVQVLSTTPKIVSNAVRIEVFQITPVSRYEKSRKLLIALYDGFTEASVKAPLTLDSGSPQASERVFSATLYLLQGGKSAPIYQLRIFDEDDPLNPLFETSVHNQTLIQPDF